MSQIALPLDWPADAGGRDFLVTDANRAVMRHLEHWALWPVMATLLAGPRKSGRSLLGRSFVAQMGGELADGAERMDEEALFHAWNRAQDRRRPLLMIVDEETWTPQLPDLRSRIAATPRVQIGQPDDALAAGLIEKLLARRGLPPSPELVRYLVPRIERSYLGIHRAIDALDELALQKRQGATLPLARRALAELDVIDESRRAG